MSYNSKYTREEQALKRKLEIIQQGMRYNRNRLKELKIKKEEIIKQLPQYTARPRIIKGIERKKLKGFKSMWST